MIQKIITFLKNLVFGDWKPTIAAIFGVIMGVCLTVIVACGAVLRQAIFDDKSITDHVALGAAVVTRDGAIMAIGLLCLIVLLGAIALTIAKFMTAIARQRAIKHRYDTWKTNDKRRGRHDTHDADIAHKVIPLEDRNRRRRQA